MSRKVKFHINQDTCEVQVEPQELLLDVLRDKLGLKSVRYGCGTGECGTCTVLVEGKPVRSCLTLAAAVDRKKILTIEGLDKNPIQEMFVKYGAIQCGFCTPGFILTAKSLLDKNPDPSEEEIREYMRGNLCRCTGYVKITEAILASAKALREGGS